VLASIHAIWAKKWLPLFSGNYKFDAMMMMMSLLRHPGQNLPLASCRPRKSIAIQQALEQARPDLLPPTNRVE